MADDFQEKTEEPSEKKLSDARKKGQVAKSQDFNSGFMLFLNMLIFFFFSSFFITHIRLIALGVLSHLHEPFATTESLVAWFRVGVKEVLLILSPFFIAGIVFGLAVNIYQVGFAISTESLNPKWKNVNIFNMELYKKFFNVQALTRLFLGILKMVIVGVISFFIIDFSMPDITRAMLGTVFEIFFLIGGLAFKIGIVASILLIALGITDLIFQKWKFTKDMRMSRQEVKDERKQTEGDVQLKSKMRQMMQSYTQSRMKSNVPHADVVVANPIHFAIAIKYKQDEMPAPVCVAKGARKMALSIKEIAKENNVPIVENPPLAQTLYKTVEVGALIPPEFYHSIAEVLAYVYKLNEKSGQEASQLSTLSKK